MEGSLQKDSGKKIVTAEKGKKFHKADPRPGGERKETNTKGRLKCQTTGGGR